MFLSCLQIQVPEIEISDAWTREVLLKYGAWKIVMTPKATPKKITDALQITKYFQKSVDNHWIVHASFFFDSFP